MSVRLRWYALACIAAVAAGAPRAEAQAALPTHSRVVVVGCAEGVQERALLDQVRVELLSAGVIRVDPVELYAEADGEYDTFDVATLRIDFGPCQPVPRDIVLGIADRRSGKHVEQSLSVAEIPEGARSRAIALSLVELLRGSWRSLIPVSTPLAEPVVGPAPASTSEPRAPAAVEAPEAKSGARIEWLAMSRIYPQTDSGDLATSMSVSTVVGSRLRMRMGGTAAGGGGDGSSVHIFQGTGRLGLAMCSASDRPGIEVGTAWDVGYAQLRGSGAGRNGGFITIGTIEATLRVPAAKGIEALVSLHAGYVLMPVTLELPLDDRRKRATGIDGSVLGVGIGLAGIL